MWCPGVQSTVPVSFTGKAGKTTPARIWVLGASPTGPAGTNPTCVGPFGSNPLGTNPAGPNFFGMNPMAYGYMPMFTPVMPGASDSWSRASKPKFSGLPQDFAKFEVEWDQVVNESLHFPCTEPFLLTEFGRCLDSATQVRLRTLRKGYPGLTLTAFRQELQKEFSVDAQRQRRRD